MVYDTNLALTFRRYPAAGNVSDKHSDPVFDRVATMRLKLGQD